MPYDRGLAIALRDHLTEAAGLIPRWHDEVIAARIQPAREAIIEAEESSNVARMLHNQAGQGILEPGIPIAQHGEAPAGRKDGRGRLQQDVDSLLIGEARHRCE